MENLEFSNENIINLVQNVPVLWDSSLNSTEEEKEIAWKHGHNFGQFLRSDQVAATATSCVQVSN